MSLSQSLNGRVIKASFVVREEDIFFLLIFAFPDKRVLNWWEFVIIISLVYKLSVRL